ncbi:Uncharacterised protein [Vibrio cholerae]|nr:Uncharacterised protein [Vibrio cholerae]
MSPLDLLNSSSCQEETHSMFYTQEPVLSSLTLHRSYRVHHDPDKEE